MIWLQIYLFFFGLGTLAGLTCFILCLVEAIRDRWKARKGPPA